MHRSPWLCSRCPLWVWAQHVSSVFLCLCICVKHCRLPAWWMPLFVAQVRRHPWWDGPTVHHFPSLYLSPTSPPLLPCAPQSILPLPIPAVHDEWPPQETRSPISSHFSSATSISSPFHRIASFFPFSTSFFCHPQPYISRGRLVVNESPLFFI